MNKKRTYRPKSQKMTNRNNLQKMYTEILGLPTTTYYPEYLSLEQPSVLRYVPCITTYGSYEAAVSELLHLEESCQIGEMFLKN